MEEINTPDDRDQILFDLAVLMYEFFLPEAVPMWSELYILNYDYNLAEQLRLNVSGSYTMHLGLYFPTLNYN